MKGQISILEAIVSSIALFVAFTLIINPIEYQTKWNDATVISQGRDILISVDRLGTLQNFSFSSSYRAEILNRIDAIKDFVITTGTSGTVGTSVYIACDCTADQVTYLQNVLAEVKFNSRTVNTVVCSTTLPAISTCGSTSTYPDALVIWGYKDLTSYVNALLGLINSGSGVLEIADIPNSKVDDDPIDPDDVGQKRVFGLKFVNEGNFPAGSDIILKPANAFYLPYQSYKSFYHLPYLLKGTVQEIVPIEGGIAPCTSGIISTTESQVVLSSDDARHDPDSFPGYSHSDTFNGIYAGNPGATGQATWGGWRWTGLTIPANSVISEAYIEFTQEEFGFEITTTLAFQDSQNPITFSSSSSPYHRWSTHTLFELDWFWPRQTPGSIIKTPNLAAGIQELVNRYGIINTVVLLEDGTGVPANTFHKWVSFEGNPSQTAKLTVKYSQGVRGEFNFKNNNYRFWVCGTSAYWDTNGNNIADMVVEKRNEFTLDSTNFFLNYADVDEMGVSFKSDYTFNDFIYTGDNNFNKVGIPILFNKTRVLLSMGFWDIGEERPIAGITLNGTEDGKAVWMADFVRGPTGLADSDDDHKHLLTSLIFSILNKRPEEKFQQIGQIIPYVNVNNTDILEMYRIDFSIGSPF